MKWLKKIGFATMGVLIGLLLAEALARIFLPHPARQIALLRMRAPDLQMDDSSDVKNPNYNPFLQRRPDSEWVCDGRTSERMNNEGFRDRNFVISKTTVKTRVMILGDSFTEGWMAPRMAAFPRILESELGDGCEVLNFGLANRSPLRYLALYDQIARKYQPDIVLVCLYRNDVAEDEALRPYARFDARGIPGPFDYARYFRHTPRMPQTRWEKRRDKWQWHLCQRSRLFPYLAVFFTVDPDFRRRILEMPAADSFEKNWRNTAGYLASLKDLVESDKARFQLAYVPDLADFQTDDPLLAHLRQFAADRSVAFFDAAGFMSTTDPALLYLPGDGHFSPEGHQRYARKLAAWLRPRLAPKGQSVPP